MSVSRLSAIALAFALAAAGAAQAQPAGGVMQACSADLQKVCPDAKPGGGAIRSCMRAHFKELSEGCKSAISDAMSHRQSQGAGGGASAGTH
jgi:hypothetical protein